MTSMREKFVQTAYAGLANEHMLSVQMVSGWRALVPSHWRDRAERDAEPYVALMTEMAEQVLSFHTPSTDHGEGHEPYCLGCWAEGGYDGAPNWPCTTARIVQGWS